MKYQSHPLAYVIPVSNWEMICHFKNGKSKLFDFKPIMEKYPQFKALKKGDLFFRARVDLGGLCVTFNEDLDISEEALYQKGVEYDVKKENKKVMKTIYAFMKYCRKQEKVSQKNLSIISKIPQSGIARIESGKSDVQLGTLLNYLEPLGYTLDIKKK